MGITSTEGSLQDICLEVNLGEARQREIMNVLGKFSDVFTDVLGRANLIEQRIELNENEQIRSKPYLLPYAVWEELKRELRI